MTKQVAAICLTILWSIGLIASLSLIYLNAAVIPLLFSTFIDTAIDSFGGQCALMLGYVFAIKRGPTTQPADDIQLNRSILFLTFFISLAYIFILLWPIVQFALDRQTAASAIETISSVRPKITFLVASVFAFYFGSAQSTTSNK